MDDPSSFVWLGAIGGALPDALRLAVLARQPSEFMAALRSPGLWISVVLLMGLGALIVYLLGATGAFGAVVTGAAAPSIFSNAIGQAQRHTPSQTPPAPSAPLGVTSDPRDIWTL